MTASTFLFCYPVSAERIRWFAEMIKAAYLSRVSENPGKITVFLTGDALFSLVDARTRPTWKNLSEIPSVRIIADGDELQLQGLRESVAAGCPLVQITKGESEGAFWESLVSTLRMEWVGTNSAAFLLCNSPYMSRVPVYMIRFLTVVHKAGLHPELYSYLDGVHTLHDGQRPSEFENIGESVSILAGQAASSGRESWFAACSRCATARGYCQMNAGTGFCEPVSCIEDLTIRPLRDILNRFSGDQPIVSHVSGGTVPEKGAGERIPHLVMFITNLPYCTEWTFGGLSLAIAAAMDGTATTVIFIEDGVYALHGRHEVPRNDRVFNIQEMIAVTTDIENLHYLVHSPSLEERGIQISEELSMIQQAANGDLARILFGTEDENMVSALRMIFF